MLNIEALKLVYVALGGSSSTVADMTVSADVIAAIATQITTAGIATKELPTVSATNNGQVLTVVSGNWAAAALPGG
jgi:hypothetical protein